MVLALENDWIWDSWFARDGAIWHAFFLKAPKSLGDPDLRHWNVTIGHATSGDLQNWTHHGTCFSPAASPAWDDFTTWTGSVVQDDDGLWHLFYTGTSRAENGLVQRIGHATSHDLQNWTRVGNGLCLDVEGPHAGHYDSEAGLWDHRAFRDPWVMRDPSGTGWIMALTARASGVAEPNDGGAIGFATSADLYNWHLGPPLHVGGFGQLEVPQIFTHDGRWFCLFCTDAGHFSEGTWSETGDFPQTGSHYLIAPDVRGPWSLAKGPMFDGADRSARYASHIVRNGDDLAILGFRDGKGAAFGGYVMDPEPLHVDAHGRLVFKFATTQGTRA